MARALTLPFFFGVEGEQTGFGLMFVSSIRGDRGRGQVQTHGPYPYDVRQRYPGRRSVLHNRVFSLTSERGRRKGKRIGSLPNTAGTDPLLLEEFLESF